MARQVYNFSKIRKEKTKAGSDALIMGIVALIIIAALIIYAIITKGNVGAAGLLIYVAMMLSAVGAVIAYRSLRNPNYYGRLLKVSLMMNAVCFLLTIAITFYGLMPD